MSETFIFVPIIFLILVIIAICATNICIVPQEHIWMIQTLGKHSAMWQAGLHIKIPLIQVVARKISLKEQVADFRPQPVITKDNVTMMVDSVVYLQIFDAYKFTYCVETPMAAIENLAATTLRNIIGSMTLDETLTGRDSINGRITQELDEATDKWGIKVSRVEVKNIDPPAQIKDAMEKQMKAEREKRENILTAEGHKQAEITKAEGERQAIILKAQAEKEKKIAEAQAQAESLRLVAEAQAQAISIISNANPSDKYLTLKQFETLEKVADGKATKLVVPSNMASNVGLINSLVETSGIKDTNN